MARGAPIALLLALSLSGAHGADTVAPLDSCLARLDPALDVGFAKIRARCPELDAALRQAPWAAQLPKGWDEDANELSALGLGELRTLAGREQAGFATARSIDPSRAAAVLARIARSEAAHTSAWLRFKNWLRRLLAPPAQQDDGWLRRLFGDVNVSTTVLEAIRWVSMALVILLALGIVLNELRLAGVLRRTARSRRAQASHEEVREPTLQELEQAAPERQPALLLELIVRALTRAERLAGAARALTVGELLRSARVSVEERSRLDQLAHLSEELRYGERTVPASRLREAVREGWGLLAALRPAPVRL